MAITIQYRCNDRFLAMDPEKPPENEPGLVIIQDALTIAKETMDRFKIQYAEGRTDRRTTTGEHNLREFAGYLELAGLGEKCEKLRYGWKRLDLRIELADGRIHENFGWNGKMFCKTRYARDWARTHLAVAETIYRWQAEELVTECHDESRWLPGRDRERFAREHRMNETDSVYLSEILEQTR